MHTYLKPLGIVAMALALMASVATDAEAGRWRRHHGGGGGVVAGVAAGVIAGVIISNIARPRYHDNYYTYSSGPSYEPECYRGAPRCHSRWDCWVNQWGREVCERIERCNRPLICE